MLLDCLLILLVIIGITFLIVGIFKKSKKISFSGIAIIIITIAIGIGVITGKLYDSNERETNKLNEVSSINNSESKAIEYYKKNLEEIPKELTAEEAVNRDFFVFDGTSGKVYNEEKLKSFVENTKLGAENRKKDEIIIAIYNINGDPIIYNIGYDDNTGFALAIDGTRIDLSKTELGTSNKIPEEYLNIVVNTNFPKEYYEVSVEDTGFESNVIYLKSNSSEFNDVEIARYMTNEG